MQKLAHDIVSQMPQLTATRHTPLALENARENQPNIYQTIRDLPSYRSEDPGSAIIISGGPSLHRKDSVAKIVESGYKGTVVCVDGALGHCLRNGLVPDYVVVLDPHPTRVIRWFGDPGLTSIPEDDYFRRQEIDPYIGVKELSSNRQLTELVNQNGPNIKALVATSAAATVAHRCASAGMDLFWWNPILDDIESPDSVTRELYRANNAPCLASGGNVGTASWVLAHSIMGIKNIALVGMDFGYAPGTPIEKTQYYAEISDLFDQRSSEAFIELENPILKETWFTDPAYYWYRQSFLDMAPMASCNTYNCTEGGTLIGNGVDFIPLAEFLSNHNQ